MMVKRILIPGILLGMSLLILGMSLTIEEQSVLDPSSASFFPALLSIIMLMCALAIWKRGVIIPSSNQEEASAEDDDESMVEPEVISRRDLTKRLVLFTLLVALFAFLMNYIPFLLVSALYLFVSMLLLSRHKWKTSLITALFTAGVVYYTFVYLSQIVFPA